MRKAFRENFYRMASFVIAVLFIVLILYVVRESFIGDLEPHRQFLFELIFLLLLAVLAEVLVLYLKLENIIILMVFGILISPSFLSMVWPNNALNFSNEVIRIFAEVGAIILLFKVGLHHKIEKVFTKKNMLVASFGVILPFLFGYIYASGTGGDIKYAMFLGAAMAATSVGVTVAVLKNLKLLKDEISDVIIGAAVIDDILALMLLAFVNNVASGSGLMSIIPIILVSIVFILGAVITGKYLIIYIDQKEMGPKRFLLCIAYMLFLAYVAEIINLSSIVGAFIAGIILSKSRNYHILDDKLFGLEYPFTPIFFISLGLLVDVRALFMNIWPILLLTFLAILSKVIGCGIMSYFSGINARKSLAIGIGMVPRGEVALIIASVGLAAGVFSNAQYSVVSAMALLTSFIVPIVLPRIISKGMA